MRKGCINLFLHYQFKRYAKKGMISKSNALYVISRYMRFIPKKIKHQILDEMVEQELLEWYNKKRPEYKIINGHLSEEIGVEYYLVPIKHKKEVDWFDSQPNT